VHDPGLAARVDALETEVSQLKQAIDRLTAMPAPAKGV